MVRYIHNKTLIDFTTNTTEHPLLRQDIVEFDKILRITLASAKFDFLKEADSFLFAIIDTSYKLFVVPICQIKNEDKGFKNLINFMRISEKYF